MKLSDFKVLTFDCYGTLIDWESGLLRGLEPMLARLGEQRRSPAAAGNLCRLRDRAAALHAVQTLPGPAAGRLQAGRRAFRRRRVAQRMRSLRSLDRQLAGVRRQCRSAEVAAAALQAGHPVERRQPLVRRQQRPPGCHLRRGLHGGGHRLLQAVAAQFRLSCCGRSASAASAKAISCTPHRAFTTTTCRPTPAGFTRRGSTGAPAVPAAAPPSR